MFRAMNPPIFRSTRLCYSGCIIPQAITQSIATEDGWDYRPKHVELIGIINKPLLLHLIGVCIIYTRNNITCRANCNYRTTTTLYTLEMWFVLGK